MIFTYTQYFGNYANMYIMISPSFYLRIQQGNLKKIMENYKNPYPIIVTTYNNY